MLFDQKQKETADEIIKHELAHQVHVVEESQPDAVVAHNRAAILSEIDAILAAKKPRISEDEWTRYKQQDIVERNENMLLWWKEKEKEFPKLSRLVRKVWAMQSSNTSAERMASLSGNVITKKRCSLKNEHAKQLIMLKKNSDLF